MQGVLPPDVIAISTSPSTDPFWKAAGEHRLVIPQCTTCGTFRLPPSPFCFHCRAQGVEWIEHDGAGEIYSFDPTGLDASGNVPTERPRGPRSCALPGRAAQSRPAGTGVAAGGCCGTRPRRRQSAARRGGPGVPPGLTSYDRCHRGWGHGSQGSRRDGGGRRARARVVGAGERAVARGDRARHNAEAAEHRADPHRRSAVGLTRGAARRARAR